MYALQHRYLLTVSSHRPPLNTVLLYFHSTSNQPFITALSIYIEQPLVHTLQRRLTTSHPYTASIESLACALRLHLFVRCLRADSFMSAIMLQLLYSRCASNSVYTAD